MITTCTKCDSPLPELATTCYSCNSEVESYELTIASSASLCTEGVTTKLCSTCYKQLPLLTARCYECGTISDEDTYQYYNKPVDGIGTSDAYKDLVEAIDKLEKRISVLEGKK